MYKNIVFDLGGVVVEFDPKNFLLERFYNEEIEDKVYDIVFGSTEWRMLDAGELTREEGNAIMLDKAREQGCLFEVQSVLDDFERSLKTRRKTVDIMKKLRKMGFNLYYLSNIAEDTLNSLKTRDFWPLFKGGLASYQLRTNKPDPRMYDELLGRFHLMATETIFTDDNELNANAAYEFGITGIHFTGSSGFIKALAKHGIDLE